MAIQADTYMTYDQRGIKESFEDIVSRISPTETPFYSALKKKAIHNTLHQWQVEDLAAAANNKHLQGDDTDNDAQTPTDIFNNNTQISKKVIRVSGTSNATDAWGRGKNELAYLVAKAGEELKRDVEFGLTQNGTTVVDNGTNQGQSRGLEGWIFTNNSLGAGGAAPNPVPATNTGPGDSGTPRALTESLIRGEQQKAYQQGGNPTVLMVGPFNRGVVDGFTGFATRMDDSKDRSLTATIDFYIGPFGKLKVTPNRFQRERTAFLLDMRYFKLGVLRAMDREKLAKTGDADRVQIVYEYTLISLQQKASAAVRDLTTS